VERTKLPARGHVDVVVFQLARTAPEVYRAPARRISTVVPKILQIDALAPCCAAAPVGVSRRNVRGAAEAELLLQILRDTWSTIEISSWRLWTIPQYTSRRLDVRFGINLGAHAVAKPVDAENSRSRTPANVDKRGRCATILV